MEALDLIVILFTIVAFIPISIYIYICLKEKWDDFGKKQPKEKEYGMKLNVIQFILWVAYVSVGIIDRNVLCCVLGGAGIAFCVYDFILERKARGK